MRRIIATAFGLAVLVAAAGAKPNPSIKSKGNGKHYRSPHGDELIVTPITLDDGSDPVDVLGGTVDGVTMEAPDDQPPLKVGQRVKKEKRGAIWRLVPEDSKESWFGPTVAHAYTWNGRRWKDGTLRYYVNVTNPAPPAPMTPDATIAAMQAATLRWVQQTNAKIAVVSMGLTTNNTVTNNRHNDVFWRPPSADDKPGRAMSTIFYYGADGYLLDADLVKFISYGTFYPAGACVAGPYHQADDDISTHEVGHMLGFGHSTVAGATMWPSIPAQCDASWRSLHPDDIQAALIAYGRRQ